MKKSYNKPEIAFDNFGLSANFASTCPNATNHDQYTCGWTIAGRVIFVDGIDACKYVSADGEYGVCYYVPSGDNQLFNS